MQIPDPNAPDGFVAYDIPAESLRFGRMVRRYVMAGEDAAPMVESVTSDNADLAIVRVPTSRLDVVSALFRAFDEVVLADCLVVYTRDNQRSGNPLDPQNVDWELLPATLDDRALLDLMTDRIFANYRNHYSANPRLREFDLGEAYQEWVVAHVSQPGRECFLARVSGEPVGFATVGLGIDDSEGVLYGVLPEHQGRGIYRDLIRSTVHEFIQRGYSTTRVSSQIDNLAVQRVWVTEGFFLSHSYYTIHINGPGS